MRDRPRASLGRIIHDLGTTVLDVAASPGGLDAEVTGVHIYDPLDELIVPAGAILLAVGVQGAADICGLLARAPHAAGVVVKLPVDVDERVRAAVRETGVAVLGLTRAASWAQVAALLRSLLAEGELAEPGEGAHGDLFSLANAVCALLDAPVTIEDRSSRVLAYSGRQDEADRGRVETVLGRQVPERYLRLLDEQGVFRRLYQSQEPIHIELDDGSPINREAVAVRAGDEILGSIWVAVRDPLNAQRRRALSDAAKIVALRLLHERAGADTQRRLRADLLSTVLAGGADAAEAAGRLGIATTRLCVLAAQLTTPPSATASATALTGTPATATASASASATPSAPRSRGGGAGRRAGGGAGEGVPRGAGGGGVRGAGGQVAEQVAEQGAEQGADHAAESARAESDRQRFCDALALHVAAIHPKAAAALVGSVAYAVLPMTPGGDEEARAVRVAESFLARVGPRHAANIGVGRLAMSLAQVARSRADADRALRVLRTRGVAGRAAGYSEVHFESLLLQVADVAAAEEQAPTGPYRRLLDHDAEHGTELAATLEAYLDAFGDVSVAAARVHVHPNTFRYRLKRLAEIGGLDLDDPDARLTVQLQLRIFGRRH
ncbi:PucR family transcriptional regulator [[Actinomadura] parvosata subsp. kistnae]|uniref:PucR family transcriptional regulator n=2 Tax=Nonomuraea TaxID=83681 RepID=A0A1V0A215_9ACTN|nr:PucR family transcriptional regulator [Nonomuraea sp. ATCC 55076]AQZ64238.1 PucR family transcriptional regulator [Nonomuraea sp. ATCC 55076]